MTDTEKKQTAREKIEEWRRENPNGTQVDCINAGVASRQSVYRVWPSEDPKRARRGAAKRSAETKLDTKQRTERISAFITPEEKRRLKYLCADDDITTSEWISQSIANAWGNRTN